MSTPFLISIAILSITGKNTKNELTKYISNTELSTTKLYKAWLLYIVR